MSTRAQILGGLFVAGATLAAVLVLPYVLAELYRSYWP